MYGSMGAPSEEFRAYVIRLYTDYRNNGPTKSLYMLELLDKLDLEYTHILTLGRWSKKEDTRLLSLIATFINLQSNCYTLQSKYSSL